MSKTEHVGRSGGLKIQDGKIESDHAYVCEITGTCADHPIYHKHSLLGTFLWASTIEILIRLVP